MNCVNVYPKASRFPGVLLKFARCTRQRRGRERNRVPTIDSCNGFHAVRRLGKDDGATPAKQGRLVPPFPHEPTPSPVNHRPRQRGTRVPSLFARRWSRRRPGRFPPRHRDNLRTRDEPGHQRVPRRRAGRAPALRPFHLHWPRRRVHAAGDSRRHAHALRHVHRTRLPDKDGIRHSRTHRHPGRGAELRHLPAREGRRGRRARRQRPRPHPPAQRPQREECHRHGRPRQHSQRQRRRLPAASARHHRRVRRFRRAPGADPRHQSGLEFGHDRRRAHRERAVGQFRPRVRIRTGVARSV